LYYGATLLDLLYQRAQLHHHDLDIAQLRYLLEHGATMNSSTLLAYPCPLINDCAQFYIILLECDCSSIFDPTIFICHLLYTISIYTDSYLLYNRATIEWISTCDYFMHVVQLAHYLYCIEQLYSIIDRQCLPCLCTVQSNDKLDKLRDKLTQLRSTPLKLSEIVRKRMRILISVPCKERFQQIGFTGHLLEFLVQTKFSDDICL
jgi:hypothetical protein